MTIITSASTYSIFVEEMDAVKVDPKKLTVKELKAELEKRGLDSTGLKVDLTERLQVLLKVHFKH